MGITDIHQTVYRQSLEIGGEKNFYTTQKEEMNPRVPVGHLKIPANVKKKKKKGYNHALG
jgi:hypothetical protein